jgi:hypothetical protein
MNRNSLVIGIYPDPEMYPPTLNAIRELSNCFPDIHIVHRQNLKGAWRYPAGVRDVPSGTYISGSGQERASTPRKIMFFLRFLVDLFSVCIRRKPGVILLYDHQALFAYRLLRPALRFKHLVWYHNHDVAELSAFRKFSIGWFSCKSERKFFGKIDLFTLPTEERLKFFPMREFRGECHIIPNYPSLFFYGPFYQPGKRVDEIRLIFQGRIGEGHGLEEIIPLLSGTVDGKPLSLVLKGPCTDDYRERLLQLARSGKVEEKISFVGITPYEEVPRLAASCHIGIAIFSGKEIMHLTLGTASNKIYEYAAVGLPILYLEEAHFSRHLQEYEWAFPVWLEPAVLQSVIAAIARDYASLSAAAHDSFCKKLNFEHSFRPVLDALAARGFARVPD